jgi:hypothetical protein
MVSWHTSHGEYARFGEMEGKEKGPVENFQLQGQC